MPAPNVHTPELRLIEAAAEGEPDARRQLFENYRDVAYGVALRVTGRHEDALDVVQDAFIKAFDGLGEFRGRKEAAHDSSRPEIRPEAAASFKTWLLRIVTNRALDVLRSRKVRLAVSLEGEDDEAPGAGAPASADEAPGAQLESREEADRMNRAIDRLPPDQKCVFSLYASGELTYGQIAEIIGIPIGTVMSRIFHARRKLQQLLAE